MVQRSLFSGREPGFLQDSKTDYPVSLLTLVLFPYEFWVFFSGGNPAERDQFFDAINMVAPDQSRSEQRSLLSGTYLSPMAPGHGEGERGLWGLTCCLCILSDVHG